MGTVKEKKLQSTDFTTIHITINFQSKFITF